MFVEELTKITESEQKADEIQKKAKIDYKQILEDAKIKKNNIIEDAENKGKEIYGHMIEEGQKKSDEQYNEFLKSTERDCCNMIEKAKENQNATIEFIAERIVGNSVNN